jgi:raffinose/stachyose/melibiose transport system substrate-binding protein
MKCKPFLKGIILTIFLIALLLVTILINSDATRNAKVGSGLDNITTISFASSWGGMDTKAQGLEKVLKDFERENSSIKVINKSRGNDDFLFTLKTDFAQGNDPDVFGLWPGSDRRLLIKAGKVADLTEELNREVEWKNSFYNEAWKYDTYEGKIYGIPTEIIYEGLFINKDIFEKYKIKIPESYEDLKVAIKELKDNDIVPIAFNCTPEGTFLYQNIVMKLGGIEDTETPYENGIVKECYLLGMEYMRELYKIGAFPSNAFTLDDKGRNELFLQKKAAMIVQGSWFIGEGALKATDKSVDIIPFPYFKEGKADKTAIVYGIGNGNFHMSRKAFDDKNKREAGIKLLKYITSKEKAETIVNPTGSIINIRGVDKNLQDVLSIKGKNLINSSKELVGPTDSFMERTDWEKVLVKNFPQMLEGKIDPKDIFSEME